MAENIARRTSKKKSSQHAPAGIRGTKTFLLIAGRTLDCKRSAILNTGVFLKLLAGRQHAKPSFGFTPEEAQLESYSCFHHFLLSFYRPRRSRRRQRNWQSTVACGLSLNANCVIAHRVRYNSPCQSSRGILDRRAVFLSDIKDGTLVSGLLSRVRCFSFEWNTADFCES